MSAWSRRRARKAEEKRRRAQDRLHGRGAVSRAPARRRDSDWADDVGEFIVDVLLALPRGILWLISKALD
jgi:hypothetical protein